MNLLILSELIRHSETFSPRGGTAPAAQAEHGIRGTERDSQQTRGQHEAGGREARSGSSPAQGK